MRSRTTRRLITLAALASLAAAGCKKSNAAASGKPATPTAQDQNAASPEEAKQQKMEAIEDAFVTACNAVRKTYDDEVAAAKKSLDANAITKEAFDKTADQAKEKREKALQVQRDSRVAQLDQLLGPENPK